MLFQRIHPGPFDISSGFTLGLTPVNLPQFSEAEDLDPTKFKLTIENRMSTRYSCVCSCLSYILTGRLAWCGKLQ